MALFELLLTLQDGTGSHLYILDTGAHTSHEEFLSIDGSYSRIDVAQDMIRDGRNGEDCDGHGTHVTALAAGRKYGVAKNASVHIVRVLDCEGYASPRVYVDAGQRLLVPFVWSLGKANNHQSVRGVAKSQQRWALMAP